MEDEEPFFNVYRSVAMSAVGILALRSSQNGGAEYKIPDFSNEEERKLYENDNLSPFPDENGNATMPCCSHPDYCPTEEDYAEALHTFWVAQCGIHVLAHNYPQNVKLEHIKV